ncbi:unnamed protein product [Rotaria sp. Silwood1]|nr:unnamed protein product [Rotaria sp. Silwood1]
MVNNDGTKITFSIEGDAIDPQTGKLNRDKHLSVNGFGLTLHIHESNFKAVTFSDKIKAIAHDLKFIKPAIRQTMYIFKQPFIGEKVTPHRDATYVFNEPLKVDGIWIALEDATIENGCLWMIPGSHAKPSQRRLIRNPNEQEFNEGKALIFIGEEEQYDNNAFVPVEVKADVPTGIYALQIPSCATWNKTGITVAGNANTTAGSDAASLNSPVGIFLDNNYTLYIADRDNHRIVKYAVNATTGVVVAGNGTPGNSPSQLRSPKGVAVDQMGAIIVADGGNFRIQRFPFGSTVATTIALNSSANLLGDMRDLHIDVNNNIYVTDSDYSRVVKFYPNNGIGVILAGNSGAGSAADQLQGSYGNFIDGNDTLYVADSGNHRVQMWPAGATNGTTIAGITNTPGSGLLRLKSPMQVIVDNNGYYFIADSGNNRIVKWISNYAAGGTCIVGCTGSVGNASNQLNTPRDLKFDASGNLYVSDRDNNRVQKFMLEISANCSISK